MRYRPSPALDVLEKILECLEFNRVVKSLILLAGSAAMMLQGCASLPSGQRTYIGELASGGRSSNAAVTTFLDDPPRGSYQFLDGDGSWVQGSLSGCQYARPLNLVCQWTDRYGKGVLDVTFTPSLDAFDGTWSSSDEEEAVKFPWSGVLYRP